MSLTQDQQTALNERVRLTISKTFAQLEGLIGSEELVEKLVAAVFRNRASLEVMVEWGLPRDVEGPRRYVVPDGPTKNEMNGIYVVANQARLRGLLWGLWSTGQSYGYAVDFEWGMDGTRQVLLEYGRRRIIVDAEGMSVQAGGVEHHALRGGTPATDWRVARLRGRRNRQEYVSSTEFIYGVTVEYAREEDLRRIVMADKAANPGIWVFHGGVNDIRILGGLPDSWVFDTATMYAAIEGFGRQD
ncbi:hypothetical protein K488DRAFT_69534 [Vararia minispora EC-137]|uniref:Uncharacterized protein n=1 Tax=Vararia minispora EC-137 TaxID=1314806 RepID=A0ACB8QQB7_9AGAM|nr:hypothetical protein K488DRAFT_69534 [Vararia minispora EC-137]